MKKIGLIFILAFFLGALAACSEMDFSLSQQQRSADTDLTDEDLLQRLELVREKSATNKSSEATSIFNFFMDNFDVVDVVYFSEAGPDFGTPESVISIVEGGFEYFGEPDLEFSTFDIADNGVRIFYLEGTDENGDVRSVLIVDYDYRDDSEDGSGTSSGNTTILASIVDGIDISETEYLAIMADDEGERLVLRSYDLDDSVDELAGVIQFKVSGLPADGSEEDEIGKFSTLVGFEP